MVKRTNDTIMNVGTVDILDALSPSSGGAIARAMQELESKLSAWMNAAERVSGDLASNEVTLSKASSCAETEARRATTDTGPDAELPASKTPIDAGTPENPLATGAVQKSTTVEIGPAGPVCSENNNGSNDSAAARISEPAQSTAHADAAQEPETPEMIEAMLSELNPETAEAVRSRFDFFKGRKTIRELIQEFEDEADDEESLLMSLDPETAKAVRVKYRLYNGRKTVREVIAEVEAQMKSTTQQPEKKNWWGKKR